MKRFILASIFALAPIAALACAPAPTCCLDEGPSYYRPICKDFAKERKTLRQAVEPLDDKSPAARAALGKACAKVGFPLKP